MRQWASTRSVTNSARLTKLSRARHPRQPSNCLPQAEIRSSGNIRQWQTELCSSRMLDSPPQRRLLQPLHTKSSKTRLGTRQQQSQPIAVGESRCSHATQMHCWLALCTLPKHHPGAVLQQSSMLLRAHSNPNKRAPCWVPEACCPLATQHTVPAAAAHCSLLSPASAQQLTLRQLAPAAVASSMAVLVAGCPYCREGME